MTLRYTILPGVLAALLWLSAPAAVCADVAVIAHKDVPEDSLTESQVRDIYTYDVREWSNRQAIIVYDSKEKNDTRRTFYDYLGKSASRMKSIWMKKMLLGEGNPPEVAADEANMVVQVAQSPGAIGFADATHVSDSVKILAIIPSDQ